jgi:alpha-galactosidase
MKESKKYTLETNLIYLTFLFIISIFVLGFALQKEINIEINKDEVINENFYGFGAETLPWLWTKENLRQGVNEDDIKLNIERIKEMELPLTRIFVPWEIWNPSVDYKTFTFESDGMQSLYKTLDIYQELGTSVIIVTVDWLKDSPWRDVRGSSDAVLTLLEYLVKEKGYSCIHFWTLTNEPELTYGWLKTMPFRNYVQIHKLVKKGLKKRKLFVKIIVSDEVESNSWFNDSVEFLYETADIFSSHNYLYPNEIVSIPDFFKDKINIINKNSKKEMSKPFFLCEFGFRGKDFGTYTNNLMNDFDYGLLTAELCIDALNNGVSGVSIWCLHEILMPGGKKMKIGLWSYKDHDWKPKPVFYAYSLFTKYINRGSKVLGMNDQDNHYIKTACIDYNGRKSIFLLNKSNSSQIIVINGIELGQFRRYLYCLDSIPTKDQRLIQPDRVIKSKGSFSDEIPAKSFILYTNL